MPSCLLSRQRLLVVLEKKDNFYILRAQGVDLFFKFMQLRDLSWSHVCSEPSPDGSIEIVLKWFEIAIF